MAYYTDLCAHCADDLPVLQDSHWVRRRQWQRRNVMESLKVESRHVFLPLCWSHRQMFVISEWSKDFTGRNGYFVKITWSEDKKNKTELSLRVAPKIPYHFTDNEMIASYLMHINRCQRRANWVIAHGAWRTSHCESASECDEVTGVHKIPSLLFHWCVRSKWMSDSARCQVKFNAIMIVCHSGRRMSARWVPDRYA